MLRRLGGSSSSLWKPKNPHSLEYLKYLHGVLEKNEKVTESNKKVLVEALRAIAEILIWGDQNDGSVFDFFLERQMLTHFLSIMRQESGSLNVQLLQTLNILFENIRHETSLYFLLSNNHVNSIITHKFDLGNEEIIAYYISFLKTLSFKLNPCTIHFFFNETTNEFPLLIESLKLYDSKESMVRIAVRNIILNIVRVDDEAMLTFVKETTKCYLCDVIDGLVQQAIDLDIFVRSAANVQANRDRLREKVDDLVDLLHYISELLDVSAMAETLSGLVTSRFVIPLLLNSLAPRRDNHAILLSSETSFFFFAQFLLVVSHRETIQTLLTALLFEDHSILSAQWVRASDCFVLEMTIPPTKSGADSAGNFFETLLCAFDSSRNDDYLAFYGLMLIYAMFQNKGDVGELLSAANLPVIGERRRTTTEDNLMKRKATMSEQKGVEEKPGENSQASSADEGVDALDEEGRMRSQTNTPSLPEERFQTPPEERHCDGRVMDALLSIVDAVGRDGNRVRPITLELACLVTRQILLAIEDDQIPNVIAELAKKVKQLLVDKLAPYVNTEQLFLEWFEDEYAEFEVNHIKLDILAYELLLPPANTVMSGLPLHKRLPGGFEEKIRTNILFYLHIRKLEREMTGEADHELPLKVADDDAVDVGDCVNLNHSDLLSCTVVLSESGERLPRFLVTDRLQLILVEPEFSKRAGWAFVRFVGLLQDTQISGDSTDSKSLHIVVEGQPTRNRKRKAVLTAKFIFDDHIRCMAAKQRLTKGRQTARTLKLQAICDVLGIQRKDALSPRNPFRIVKGCPPGSVRKSPLTSTSGSSHPSKARSTLGTPDSSQSIPDDPLPSSAGGVGAIKHV